ATPTARKAALEHDVDLSSVTGTGDHGRVTREDVLRAAKPAAGANHETAPPLPPANAKPAEAKPVAAAIREPPDFRPPIPGIGFGAFKVPSYVEHDGDKVVPFTRRRRLTADHMVYSKFASPHVVTVAEVDMHRAAKLREQNKERYKSEGLSL